MSRAHLSPPAHQDVAESLVFKVGPIKAFVPLPGLVRVLIDEFQGFPAALGGLFRTDKDQKIPGFNYSVHPRAQSQPRGFNRVGVQDCRANDADEHSHLMNEKFLDIFKDNEIEYENMIYSYTHIT